MPNTIVQQPYNEQAKPAHLGLPPSPFPQKEEVGCQAAHVFGTWGITRVDGLAWARADCMIPYCDIIGGLAAKTADKLKSISRAVPTCSLGACRLCVLEL
mmetsp:Transcript_70450/g.118139  ORF Transcript_70450/g.118139 Transcript_70450/m.118139 type:complete len:100 (+) Transcript_70450:197-496(+)